MEQQVLANGGLQYVPQLAVQTIYLDFDGESTSYNGEILTIDNVEVQTSALTEERIANILAELNAKYAGQNVVFVTERPADSEYSTIYIGKTDAFAPHGNFSGVAETIDKGNQINNDNAFVLLDSTASDEQIIETIAHETDHLLGTLDHGGEGLDAYAANVIISSGTTLSGIVINDGISMNIHKGESADKTTINANGRLFVYPGGTVNNTVINPGGGMTVHGIADNTVINSGGGMTVHGIADNTTVYYAGGVVVAQSGVISNTTATNGAVRVYNGGIANNTVLNEDKQMPYRTSMHISAGGMANVVTVNAGIFHVANGGTVNSATIYSGAEVRLESGAALNDTILNGGSLCIISGVLVDGTIVNSNGELILSSGATVSNTVLNDGTLHVSSGTFASGAVVNSSGFLTVSAGGTAENILVSSGGVISIDSNGKATDITIKAGGWFQGFSFMKDWHFANITDNEIASNVIISGNSMIVNSGGVIEGIGINQGNYLIVHSGGTASIAYSPWPKGYIHAEEGAVVTQLTRDANIYFRGDSGCVTKFDSASNLNIESSHEAVIYSGGVMSNTTVSGYLTILNGGVHRGSLYFDNSSSGRVHADGGEINFSLDGRSASDDYLINDFSLITGSPTYTITVAARQSVGQYKLAQNVKDIPWMSIGYSGMSSFGNIGSAEGVEHNYKNYMLSLTDENLFLNIEQLPAVFVSAGGSVTSATVMTDVALQSGHRMNIYNGGIAKNTLLDSGSLIQIFDGGTAKTTTVNTGSMYISSGGLAEGTIVSNQGFIRTFEGGTADDSIILSGGRVIIFGGTANRTVVSGGNMNVDRCGIVNDTTIEAGAVAVHAGLAKNTVITHNTGRLIISSGAVAENTTVSAAGILQILAGASHFGTLQIFDSGRVYAYGGRIDFSISGRTENDDYIINNLSRISDAYFTVTVSDDQAHGSYKLAQGASSFTDTITIGNGTVDFGTLSVNGQAVTCGANDYRLVQTDGNLLLSVGVFTLPTLEITGNPTQWTNQDVTLTATANRGTVEYYNGFEWVKGSVLTVAENGIYRFRATDETGKVTEKEVVVDKIDKVAPTIQISGNPTTWTNQDVTLTATVSDGIVEYYNGTEWVEGSVLTVTENGTYKFRVTDEAGNVTEKDIVVDKINKVAPTIEISGNPTTWTNQDVTLTATVNEGAVEYYNGTEWVEGSVLTVTENGTYKFRVTDEAGNITEKEVIVDKIDKVAPTIQIAGNPTEWTNQDVTLTATVSDGIVEYYNGSEWVEGSVLTVTENGTYKFRVTDEAGNVTEEEVIVDKIDKVAPTIQIAGNPTEWTNQDVTLTAAVNEGTVEYYNGTEWEEGSVLTVIENGTYKFRVTDEAGNVTEKEVIVDKIDKVAPTIQIAGNPTEWTNQDVTLTATVSDGIVEYYNGTEWVEGSVLTVTENGTYKFRVTDEAGNVTEKDIVVDKINKVAPTIEISGNPTTWTNQDVTLTATVNEGTVEYYNGTEWVEGSVLTVTENGTYKFRVTDEAGNVTEEEVVVEMIDKTAPDKPVISSVSNEEYTYDSVIVSAVFSEDSVKREYSLDNAVWRTYPGRIEMTASGSVYFRGTDIAGNISEVTEYVVDNIIPTVPEDLEVTEKGLSWSNDPLAEGWSLEISKDSFEGVLQLKTDSNTIDIMVFPDGTYQWRVSVIGKDEAAYGEDIVVKNEDNTPQHLISESNGSMDLFFAKSFEVWGAGYAAQHVGTIDGWTGTNELAILSGKNKIADVYSGSNDGNVLLLTDFTNGDVLFVDDIYTALGDQARLSKINEIRAGAGDDIIDMTSQQFVYTGDGITIYGGDGHDTIWVNNGDNTLYGDFGNDRIIGAAGDDIIIGGSGNDLMHGGGGDDIFTFGKYSGWDTVEQLSTGSVTLWFAEGSEDYWNQETMTYSDHRNSCRVLVTGVSEVTLRFGEDDSLPDRAFSESASMQIFEDKNNGMLA